MVLVGIGFFVFVILLYVYENLKEKKDDEEWEE